MEKSFAPLAERMRPTTLSEVVGQRHIVGAGSVLSRMVEQNKISNMIFFGPPGTGKTTVANIAAKAAGKRLYKLNGTTSSTADVKQIVEELDSLLGTGGVVVYLDEIQYFNKKQQQTLLSYMENGRITLIASTTENPFFYVYPAILSRSAVFEFKPITEDDIREDLERAAKFIEAEQGIAVEFQGDALSLLAAAGGGDLRRSINCFELAVQIASENNKAVLTDELIMSMSVGAPIFHDKDGDSHYDLLSAFQKSLRGSDENAGIYYLARLLEGGDLIGACRRLMVIAAEDIGLAYPMALPIVKSAVDMALQLGLPEARIPLADAVILLCTAPKSNSGLCAIDAALGDIRSGKIGNIPDTLRDANYSGAKKLGHGKSYVYPHDYPNHYFDQQYLPDALAERKYYQFGDNKTEQAAKVYSDKIKGGH